VKASARPGCRRGELSSSKLVQQRLRLLQIERVEAFGEPTVDRSEQLAGLLPLPRGWAGAAGEVLGTARGNVRTEEDAVVLLYRARSLLATEWKAMEQRVPITWTNCHVGGRRPWFICPVHRNGRYCGQRVAVLYAAGELFACRRCYDLAYASQQEKPRFRNLRKLQKIRIRLGGSPDPFEPFPEKPPGMHRRTYLRLREQAETAEAFVKRV
jgi:hypothetical protein